ncbi:MAG: ATP-binding protein [Patescibacteria group bacterium]
MSPLNRVFRRFAFFAALPGMRVFWVLLPLLVALALITALELAPALALASGILLLVVATLVFINSYRSARSDYETTLEQNELKGIVRGIEDPLIAYDQNFRVFFFNPAAEKLFNLSASEVIGAEVTPRVAEKSGWRLLAQVVFPSLAPTLVYRSKAGQYPQVVDISFEEPFIELRVTTVSIVDERGRVGGFVKIIHNRTQEVSLLKSKNEFITVASHQLRTPITELNWAFDTLLKTEGLDPSAHDLIANGAVSARKVLTIVEDLLNVAKMEEGHFGYAFAETDLIAYLENILGTAMPQVTNAGLKLYFDRPKEAVPKTLIDPQKLSMVISNLLDNAVRYNVQNGQIIVRARRADDSHFVEVSVRDTGIGIPEEDMKKMFTKFFRGSNAIRFQTDGSGLGLYIAKNIIQAHGGRMWVESEPNRGSTFFFTLPTDPSLVPGRDASEPRLGGGIEHEATPETSA